MTEIVDLEHRRDWSWWYLLFVIQFAVTVVLAEIHAVSFNALMRLRARRAPQVRRSR